MRILHLDTGAGMRGGQHQLLLLVRALAARGHEQTVLARAPLDERWLSGPPSPADVWKEARKADIVHAHDARAHTLAALFGGGAPLVVSRRVAFPVKTHLFSRWKYSRPRAYLAVSRYVKGRLEEAGVAPERIAVVHDAVEVPNGAPAPAVPPEGGSPLVAAPAIDDPLKGAQWLAEACEAAGARLLRSPHLLESLRDADVFVYITATEGLGSAILLAMARRIPVIASRVGGIPELVEHERTGLLVENSPAAVTAALRRLTEDPVFARGCAERALVQVNERFTDTVMAARTEQVYRAVLENRPLP